MHAEILILSFPFNFPSTTPPVLTFPWTPPPSDGIIPHRQRDLLLCNDPTTKLNLTPIDLCVFEEGKHWPRGRLQCGLLELALWPLTAKQTDVSWFTEEEINQTCWRWQKLVTNIDLRTQQLHVGATESLNTTSNQMRRSRGTRVGERWLSSKTLWLNSCNDEKSADWQIRTCSESLSSVFVHSAVNWFCSTAGHSRSLL